ncbi:GntR family transcriptional regulator [Acuticoccus sp. I52.16.1]|uniref:GntR family transcriptional regulator n=1 Tax=Acuticoccus sp. I52.16.1 TaxID=2928472 RepID=UPI001FD35247|nr:GntR family transcriptional regulator [Acuticoccus sp. I52.16.1]UOM33308.1 GntR family transcriptional regulator [Acuticoccus sp. I52.16.1]
MPDGRPAAIHHAVLADELQREIVGGSFQVGDLYPTEAALQERFGAGRYTVRKALKILSERGLIERRRKRGSVVTSTKPLSQYVHSLRDIRGLTEFGRTTELKVAQQGFVALEDDGGAARSAGRYYRIAGLRRRSADGMPLCWSDILVAEAYADVREEALRGESPIYERILARFGLKLDYVEQSVSAIPLKAGMASLLEADGETAALLVSRRYVETGGTVFERSHNIYPGSRYVMTNMFRER